VVQE